MLFSMDEFRAFEPKKTTYALFGWPLGHTMSPELHAQLFEAPVRMRTTSALPFRRRICKRSSWQGRKTAGF